MSCGYIHVLRYKIDILSACAGERCGFCLPAPMGDEAFVCLHRREMWLLSACADAKLIPRRFAERSSTATALRYAVD